MKGGITGYKKLRRLDKSLIECRLLSEDLPLNKGRGREAKLSERGRPLTT